MKDKKDFNKDKVIKEEIEKIKNIYEQIDKDKISQCERLIEEMAYLYASMLECKKIIDDNGIVETYNNGGGQTGLKQNPASKFYLDCYKQYTATVKQLQDFFIDKDDKSKKPQNENPMKAFAEMINKR